MLILWPGVNTAQCCLDGYILSKEVYPFEIDTEGKVVKVEVQNDKFVTPKTGDTTNVAVKVSVLVSSLLLGIFLISARKKESKY